MNFEMKTFIDVDYADLDREISTTFGHSFEFVADQEANNYASYRFSIDGKSVTNEYDQRKLDEFKATGRGIFLARMLMNELCALGRIPAGEYLVRVS